MQTAKSYLPELQINGYKLNHIHMFGSLFPPPWLVLAGGKNTASCIISSSTVNITTSANYE